MNIELKLKEMIQTKMKPAFVLKWKSIIPKVYKKMLMQPKLIFHRDCAWNFTPSNGSILCSHRKTVYQLYTKSDVH